MLRLLRRFFSDLGWAVVGLSILIPLSLVFLVFGGLGSVLSALAAVLTLAMIAQAMRAFRRRRAASFLSYLEQAVRLNLPLPAVLQAAEASERGALAVRLRTVRHALIAGDPLSQALVASVPELPWRSIDLIACAEQAGTLPATLRHLVDEYRPRGSMIQPAQSIFEAGYPLMLILLSTLVVSLMAVIIFPKFEKIFRDFGLPLPPLTIDVLRFGDWAASLGLPLLPLLVVVLLIGRSTWEVFRGKRIGQRGYARDMLSVVPAAGSLMRDRALADACLVLADGLQAGRPPGELLQWVAVLQPWLMRRRIMLWEQAIKKGQSFADGAREAAMPALITGMLSVSQQTGNTPATLQFLSRYYASKVSRAKLLLHGALIPVTALVMGALVLCVILAMYLPMIDLINKVGRWVP